MAMITVKLETAVRRSFRVEQVAGMFDVALEERVRHELRAEVPGMEEKWTIGAIVGPSGSGKTTLARAAFGEAVYKPRVWPKDRAIIDVLGSAECGVRNAEWQQGGTRSVPTTYSIKELTRGLVAVGLGSPPTWLKPYHVLSGGERFRADLLRALVRMGRNLTQRHGGTEEGGNAECGLRKEDFLVVVDEFTGALDRTVAKTTSAALARLLRQQLDDRSEASGADKVVPPGRRDLLRFVAVTCHRDILPWLSPDWVVELGGSKCGMRSAERGVAAVADARLTRGRPRRPSFAFKVDRVPQAMWTRFSGEHYLSGGLAASATCYAALWNKEPIAFCAVVGALGWKGVKRIQRLVTLPEFQGMGIGGKLLDVVAENEARRGFRVTITASHPAIIAHCGRSARWRFMDVKKTGSTRQEYEGREIRSSVGRAVAAFEWR